MADEKKGPDFTKALKLGAAVRRWKEEAKTAKARADEAEARLAKAPKADDVAKLRNQLNAGKHADAFKAKALKLGIKPEMVNALRKVSGYQPTDAEPDESAIKAAIRDAVKTSGGKDVWCAPKPAEGTAEGEATAPKPGDPPAPRRSRRGSPGARAPPGDPRPSRPASRPPRPTSATRRGCTRTRRIQRRVRRRHALDRLSPAPSRRPPDHPPSPPHPGLAPDAQSHRRDVPDARGRGRHGLAEPQVLEQCAAVHLPGHEDGRGRAGPQDAAQRDHPHGQRGRRRRHPERPLAADRHVGQHGLDPVQPQDSVSFVIRDWDQVRTPLKLADLFLKPKLEALLRKVNRRVANFFTATNFNVSTTISGVGTAKFARGDFAAAWTALTNLGCPTEEEGDLFFLTSPTAYANTAADTTFNQQFVVGESAAIQAQQKGRLVDQFARSSAGTSRSPSSPGRRRPGATSTAPRSRW